MTCVIVDYDSGNLHSAEKSFQRMANEVGEEVKVNKVAPMGDPLEVALKSYRLSLRRSEAQGISVEALA